MSRPCRPLPRPAPFRPRPRAERLLVLALLGGVPAAVLAQQATSPGARDADLPVILQADRIGGTPDVETTAEGAVELQRGPLKVQADRLSFRQAEQLLKASGNVRIESEGNRFKGRELELQIERYEGFVTEPEYFIALTQAGGRAERIDFLGEKRVRLQDATYTSCGADGSGTPAWMLSAERVDLDFANNEGSARGGVLRFLGVPILAAPVLSFPVTDERKSGWLPPSLNIDSKSGLDLAVPWYWNIAPNRDATLTPTVSTRRGAGLNSEFRYLEPGYRGQLGLNLLPNDRVAGRERYAALADHQGSVREVSYGLQLLRVSDDAYWKDFPGLPSLTPRLLPAELHAERRFQAFAGDWSAYARTLHWQVLQSTNPLERILPPYQRLPQLGVQGAAPLGGGWRLDLQTEFNRFTAASGADSALIEGSRWHALGSLSRPWLLPGGWLIPKLSINAASYSTDTPMADSRSSASRVIPTFSADAGLVFERELSLFGRDWRQTLEPRVLYVRTPYREQSALPLFDTAGKDFNVSSIYTENDFSGVDRVSDANQLTAGATTRFLDPGSGLEQARLSVVQRYLFQDQRLTPDGEPVTGALSDLLLLGAAALSPRWNVDAAVQYDAEARRTSRSVLGTRYSPGPFRTVGVRYRFTRELTEQVEVGWQWPVYGAEPGSAAAAGNGCGGRLYSVGRMSYSLRDSRITGSILGFEYDAGCWIGRVVGERLSTGRGEATTRLMLQLELVGLSRLGTNPLRVLKDNIPGYQLLREERTATPPAPTSYE